MTNSPKSSRSRYQKIKELGRNPAGGRLTYLATDSTKGQTVAIEQFQFAKSDSNWSSFKAYEREIQVLNSLNHPGIPRLLNSFETANGFCMVLEYKDASSLASPRNFNLDEIKQIAICVLEILIYLQNRIPPVIHRNIKPDNILVDEKLNVYLVDFGFARIGSGEGAMSSVATGTFGFMAPEQLYNQELSKATDLYGLGATLICLLTGTNNSAIDSLIDDTGRIDFKHLVSQLDPLSIKWLEKMVQPKQEDRYASADEALAALKPLSFTLVPEVNFSQSILEFKATQLNEKITQTLVISNPITNTILEGKWEVAPHPNDPSRPSSHVWISFATTKFKANKVKCAITVDTSKLLAAQVYTRQLLLETNSREKVHNITVKVHTVPLPRSLYHYPILLLGFSLFIAVLASAATLAVILAIMFNQIHLTIGTVLGFIIITVPINSFFITKNQQIGFSIKFSIQIPIIATVLTTALGIGLLLWKTSFGLTIASVALTGLVLLLAFVIRQRKKRIENYNRSVINRIKP